MRFVLAPTYSQAYNFSRSRHWRLGSWVFASHADDLRGYSGPGEVYKLNGWKTMPCYKELDNAIQARDLREMLLNYDFYDVICSPQTWSYCWITDEQTMVCRRLDERPVLVAIL